MDKCCTNCAFFEERKISVDYNGALVKYECLFHKVKITWPDDQFCGDEYFRPVTIKRRLDNLEKLDIHE